MRITRVCLQAAAASAPALERFYGNELGLPGDAGGGRPRFAAGGTTIEFAPVGDGEPFYHFALRVPRNRFVAARDWLARTTELLSEAGSSETMYEFENWNAAACYAHDPSGNIVELIAHRELPEERPQGQPFSAGELLGVCEVGVVGPDTRAMAEVLTTLGIELWDGTLEEPGRLAFLGGRDGVLILTSAGRGWLPTGRPAEIHAVAVDIAGDRAAGVSLPGTPHRIGLVRDSRT